MQHLDAVYDFKCFCVDGDGSRILAPLNNISFNHVFLIQKSEVGHNQTMLYANQYSSSSQWEPQDGCRLLLYFPDVVIYGAEQKPYDDQKRLAIGSSNEEQKIYWMWCLEEKHKHIERTKKYAGDHNVDWWDVFFNHQHIILDNHFKGYWPLHNQFEWNIGGSSLVSTTPLQQLDNLELNNIVLLR